MENSVIAVQIANGTFVPVLNTSSRKRRRLTVTTVRDNQENVKIELFRGSDESMGDAEHIGSLVIDHVEPGPSGSPDISVLLGVDDNGNLNATATDTTSGEYQSLSVGLETIGLEGGYDVPDFQLSDEELTLDELSLDDDVDPDEEVGSVDEGPATDADGDVLDDLSFEEVEEESTAATGDEPTFDTVPDVTEGADESADLDLSSLDAADDLGEIDLDETSLAEEPEERAEDAVAMGSLDDLELETDAPNAGAASSGAEDELEELTLDSEPAEQSSLDDFAFDETDSAFTATADEETVADISLEDISLEESSEPVPAEPDDFDDFAASLEEEPSPESPPEALPAGSDSGETDDFSFDELEEEEFSFEPLEEEASAPSAEASPDSSFDTSFGEESSGADDENVFAGIADEEFSLDESFATEERGDETEFGSELVEADLGEEDFTFDEAADEAPVGEGEELAEDAELSDEEFDRLDSEPLQHPAEEVAEQPLAPRKSNAVIFVGYLILALAALGVLTYLIFRLMEGPPAPPLRAALSGSSFGALALLLPRRRR